jgi:anti-sigma B factor antagonist
MVISSRTPEGRPNACPVCGSLVRIEPSDPSGDAPCPCCGHLLWFAWEDLGPIQVLRPTGSRLDAESLDRLMGWLEARPGARLILDLGEVQSLASTALSALIRLKTRIGMGGGRLGLRHLHPDLVEVLRITRLDRVFELEP